MDNTNFDDYLKLPYTIEIRYDQGENYSGWFGRVVEWPGCMTQADNFAELGELIHDAMRAWIETALEEGQDIPGPRPVEQFSGKFIVRVPKSLHRELIEAADRDGVSLNAFANVALAKAVGVKSTELSAASHPADRKPVRYPVKQAERKTVHRVAEGKDDQG